MVLSFLRRTFINKNFGLLFLGKLISQLGDGIHYFAVVWLVLDLTESGLALGTLLIVSALPGFILTPFSGVIADIFNRKKIIVAMDLIRGVLLLTTAAIYYFDALTLPIIYAVTVLSSLCGVLFNPAIMAATPSLVKGEELVDANSRGVFSQSATGILGPITGAFLLAGFGYMGIFLINGSSFIISAVSEMFIKFPKQEKKQVEGHPYISFYDSLKKGFLYLTQHPGLRILMIGGIILSFFLSPLFGVVLPYFGKQVLSMSAQNYGFSQSSYAIGMLIGVGIVSAMIKKFTRRKLMVAGIIIHGLLLVSLGFLAIPTVYPKIPQAYILVAIIIPVLIMGIMNVQVNVPINVIMQETVPDHYRGRVFSMLSGSIIIAAPLGIGLFGILLDVIPVHFFLFICGSIIALMAIVLGAFPSFVRICDQKGNPENMNPGFRSESSTVNEPYAGIPEKVVD
jgi:MFS transporter, DHA3 family, macrolide efflux protein